MKQNDATSEKYLKLRSEYDFGRESTFFLWWWHFNAKYSYVERLQC